MANSFFAYPSNPKEVATTIRDALRLVKDEFQISGYEGWEETDIAGRFIIDPILSSIAECDFLAADITKLNFNVTFEIGFAVGKRKPLLITRHAAYEADDSTVRQVGIFDTIGYKQYNDSRQLAQMITTNSSPALLHLLDEEINKGSPVYVVLPKARTDFEIRLLSRLKKTGLHFRTFDPAEQSRLPATEAIKHITSSIGIIVPLLPESRKESQIHNFRAAFVAGLAWGLEKDLLLLQFGDDPVPLDYRELVSQCPRIDSINEHLAEFAPTVTQILQSDTPRTITHSRTFLERLNLGSSAAENEIRELQNYYLETDEYQRVLRGETIVVAGRKGSGKSALFFQLRNKVRGSKQNIVLDLKPEGYQLAKFRDSLLSQLEQGTREHTVVALWEYLLLMELCHQCLEKDVDFHLTNHKLFQPYSDLQDEFSKHSYITTGDFSERVLHLIDRLNTDFSEKIQTNETPTRISSEQLTALIYQHSETQDIWDALVTYLGQKKEIWVLFDNLDKGWPPQGLQDTDALIIRCLVDAIRKIQSRLSKRDVVFYGVVFLRNDVYEHLVNFTTDRGKTPPVVLDWTDPNLLKEMLRRRLISQGIDGASTFDKIWLDICASHISGQESFSYLLDRCLMRPRSLIDLVSQCRSYAVNLQHTTITEQDMLAAEKSYSSNLVEDIAYEIRDVYSTTADVLYHFIGAPVRMGQPMIAEKLSNSGIPDGKIDELIDVLLWWGFLGVIREGGEIAYIYTVQYKIQRLKAIIGNLSAPVVYFVNPAFWSGLEIETDSV